MKKQFTFGLMGIMFLLLGLFGSCRNTLPKDFHRQPRKIAVYPDYHEAVIPPNIAPLNFQIEEDADAYRVHIYGAKGESLILSGKVIQIPVRKWKRLLALNTGDTIYTELYLKKGSQWFSDAPRKNRIAPEEIDPYLAYRLIEPSYICYETMTINQRNLTNFDEKIIYENSLLSDGDNGQCVNCHSFQNYNRGGTMQLHLRQHLGGTLIVTGHSHARKVNLKTPYTISSGVYPSWHPTESFIAYSVNATGQEFHTKDIQKIEVLDFESDLVLYDVARNEILDIATDKDEFETYPSWNSEGTHLYYASAHYVRQTENIDAELSVAYKDLHYNLYRKSFDPHTRTFGKTDTLFMASVYGKSATLPRESPDGKYLLFAMGDYGNFHIWHKSSDLYLLNLATQEVRELHELNSPEAESYHTWSSNGRWIVFSSRREDGSYTRLYMAYMDPDGSVGKPFILPQKRPDFYRNLFKSYNIPEFMVAPVHMSPYALMRAIEKDPVNALHVNPLSEPELKPSKSEKGDFYE